MFTGIVEKTALIAGVSDGPHFRRLTMVTKIPDLKMGESIAVNGCCLTVAELPPDKASFDVVKETLDRTNLGLLKPGDSVNLERSMKIGDRIDGHFVQGHVDGRAILTNINSGDEEWRFTLEAPFGLAQYVVPKGSVALDGVSLTVAAVAGNVFEVALIPTTLRLTTLGQKSAGWPFNLEADILTKTVVSWLERQSRG
ncbi:MAG TPA: riboflavin synthase [Tepidisphaeraceae bacterium]|jgi:riboflavin synthase|nr:riboflavin synthase [Tepidisphaeraceae bacterium]